MSTMSAPSPSAAAASIAHSLPARNIVAAVPAAHAASAFDFSHGDVSERRVHFEGGAPSLAWRNLTVESTIATRKLLNDVSGQIFPGQFVAIMGHSGSGKTTLLNTLARRLDKNVAVTGDTRLLGYAYTLTELKAVAAYVLQDDVLNAHLTVEETLLYTAQLRMRADMPIEEKERRVGEVLELVGLTGCRNVTVGDALKKGISGGERKRLCVAMELLSDPSVLFLDEPTSGLDSVTAYSLCSLLKELTVTAHCTIVATIHQPQVKIFNLFDKLFILKEGSIVFQGAPEQAVSVWAAVGMPVPANANPADHLLESIMPHFSKGGKTAEVGETSTDGGSDTDVDRHKKNVLAVQKLLPVEDVRMRSKSDAAAVDAAVFHRVTLPWMQQFRILFRRSIKEHLRMKRVIITQLVQTAIVSLLIGGVFYQIGTSQASTVRRQPVLFFACINQGIFGALSVINSFPAERILSLRERAAGTYHVSAYYLAKSVAETPFLLLQPILFSIIVYWMVGLTPDAGKFFLFTFFMMLCSTAAVSLALAVSAISRTTTLAVTILPIVLEINRLFGGFFLSPANLPSYFSWLDAMSYVKYSYVGISLSELHGLQLYCKPEELKAGVCPITSGQQTIDLLGLDKLTIGACIGALFAYIIGTRVIAFIALKYLKK